MYWVKISPGPAMAKLDMKSRHARIDRRDFEDAGRDYLRAKKDLAYGLEVAPLICKWMQDYYSDGWHYDFDMAKTLNNSRSYSKDAPASVYKEEVW